MCNQECLCLSGGRFSAEASWRTSAGVEGLGQAAALTGDTGYFSFFDPNNIEVVIKVLNACAFPGSPRFWVFAAGLTNVEVRLKVTDTQTGEVKEYTNPLGIPFAPVQDTNAFATCPGLATVVSPASADLAALALAEGDP